MTTEQLTIILTVLSGVMATVQYVLRRQMDARAKEAASRARETDARITQIETDARARLTEVEARAADMQFTNTLLNTLIEVNTQQANALIKANETNERNYKVLQQIFDRFDRETTETLRTTLTAITGLATQLTSTQDKILEAIRKELADGLNNMAEIIAHQRGAMHLGVTFRFPPDDDPRWRWCKMHPARVDHSAPIFAKPFWSDGENIIGEIRKSGEVLRWIKEGPILGVYTVRKDFGVENVVRGYVNEYLVRVEPLQEEPDLETLEHAPA